MPRLVLIDGYNYLYRAYHAIKAQGRELTAPDGFPTGAMFGVVNMLRAYLKERPEYAAFVVDAPGKTFRDEIDPQYKANRPPMPDDLRVQVEPLLELVAALGFPILRVPGVEADDVIGTLALQGAAQGIDVTVSTGDKDMAQLVRPHIVLVNTMSGSRLDSDEAVIEKFGVRANQIVDYLALMGDAVDNIPGVPKCGPKTAAKWLGEYDSLDGVIANAGKISGKIGESLREALPRLSLNRELTTIKTDVPLEHAPADLRLRERHVDELRDLYKRYGFNLALKELDSGVVADAIPEKEPGRARGTGFVSAVSADPVELDPALSAAGEYETILTLPQLEALIATLQESTAFAFDTETDSLDPMQANLVGLSFATQPGKAVYIPLAHEYPGAPEQLDREATLAALAPLFTDASKHKIGQHGKYDLHVLRRHGIEVAGYSEDTMLESFVLNSGSSRHDMDSLAKRYLGYNTIKYEEVAGKGAKQILFSQVALDDATRYAAEDADITLRLHHALSSKLALEPSLERVYR